MPDYKIRAVLYIDAVKEDLIFGHTPYKDLKLSLLIPDLYSNLHANFDFMFMTKKFYSNKPYFTIN